MRLSHFIIAILVIIVWGFNFVMIKVGLQDVSPLFLCALRFFLAFFPAIFFVKRPAVPFKMIVAYGLIIFALQFALLFTSMQVGITPGLASLMLQVHVFFTILLAILFLGETPNRWQITGALVSFVGIVYVGMHVGNGVTLAGLILIIAAAAAWGVGNLITKKIGKVNILGLVVWGSVVAFPPLLGVTILVDGTDSMIYSLQHFSWLGILSIFYIVYASTWFGYGVWSWLLSQYSVATIVPFTLLVPITGMLSSVLTLGEPLEAWKVRAGLIVISGLCINLLGPLLLKKKELIAEPETEYSEA